MLEINFHPFPVIETERLLLRKITSEDANDFFELRSDPHNMRYIPSSLVKNTDDAIVYINMIEEKIKNKTGINWGISYKGNSRLIGIIGYFRLDRDNHRAEIGYILSPDFHGKGIMSEALNQLIKYGFEDLKLHSIEAVINPENAASEKILQRNSFIKEAHLKEAVFFEGAYFDKVIYSLLKKQLIL